MDIYTLTSFFMWCTILNVGLLCFWALMIRIAPDFVFRLQSKFVPISRETFDIAIYSFLGLFKIFVIIFNLVPYLALLIIA
ncbi:DUF6868 family protein [Kiloniella sp.]|uniref:DUF6868 family protein n=1 Tax=Kiloniella sp. TaxID=1938587 RepID=UPI003B015C17